MKIVMPYDYNKGKFVDGCDDCVVGTSHSFENVISMLSTYGEVHLF